MTFSMIASSLILSKSIAFFIYFKSSRKTVRVQFSIDLPSLSPFLLCCNNCARIADFFRAHSFIGVAFISNVSLVLFRIFDFFLLDLVQISVISVCPIDRSSVAQRNRKWRPRESSRRSWCSPSTSSSGRRENYSNLENIFYFFWIFKRRLFV